MVTAVSAIEMASTASAAQVRSSSSSRPKNGLGSTVEQYDLVTGK
jgi:hypothetical protein